MQVANERYKNPSEDLVYKETVISFADMHR